MNQTWQIGDRCFWIVNGIIIQGKVCYLGDDNLFVKVKGDPNPRCVSKKSVFHSLEEATNEQRRRTTLGTP
jgi:hypothetical protein